MDEERLFLSCSAVAFRLTFCYVLVLSPLQFVFWVLDFSLTSATWIVRTLTQEAAMEIAQVRSTHGREHFYEVQSETFSKCLKIGHGRVDSDVITS